MIFSFVSAFGSGEIVERQDFDSAMFDRGQVARYIERLNEGEFVEDLGGVRLDYRPLGPKLAGVEVLSETSFVVVHLLGSTDPDEARSEMSHALGALQGADAQAAEEAPGELARVRARPLVLALLPEGEEEARNLARYPVALAAAFFEARCG